MRLSTLTIVVLVAHTSSLAIAAPLPFTDEVQVLVARDENDPPAASPSGTPIPTSARWAQVASSVANKVPASFVNANVPSNFVSVVQKAIGAAQRIPGNQSPRHILPIPAAPSSSPAVVPKTNSMLERFKQRGSSAFDPPTGPAPSLTQQAVAQLKKNQAHPVAAALEPLHKGLQSRPPGSSPARKSSTGDKAVTAHKASPPARKATTAHTSSRKASSASHGHKEVKASQAHKVSQVRKAATAGKAFASPKTASASVKKAKAPKLTKRLLEIDELDQVSRLDVEGSINAVI